MRSRARRATALAASALITAVLATGTPALAASGSPHAAAAAAGSAPSNGSFAISPTPVPGGAQQQQDYFSMNAVPGEKVTESVSVANFTKAPLRLWLYPADAYTIRQGGGFAVYGMNVAPRDVGAWVSRLPKLVTIPPHKQLNIPFTFRVPKNATPGTHAGGIVAQDTVPQVVQANGQLRVKVYDQVFTRIYANVVGRLVPDYAIDGMVVTHSQPPVPLITHRNGSIDYYLYNSGNALITPTARVRVTGMFGTIMDKTFPATSQLLPGGTASYSVPWPDLPVYGSVHVYLTVSTSYGLTRTAEYSYTAVPVPFTSAAGAVIIALIVLAVLIIVRFRRGRQGRQGRNAGPRHRRGGQASPSLGGP
jgi:hypothetical protein